MSERNVLGSALESCGTEPLTGFYRDGCCSTGPEDLGRHTICAVVTAEFLEHQRSPGLRPGNANSGRGVERSLPRDLLNWRNSAVISEQTT